MKGYVQMDYPKKLMLANIPTKLEKMNWVSSLFKHIDVYIKRDDQTGFECSGNKVRKLEYLMYEVLNQNYDGVITCGSAQSNHVRATAACAAKLGLKCIAVLRELDQAEPVCNLAMTKAFGATCVNIDAEEYKLHRTEIMNDIKIERALNGDKIYVIPEGGSSALGALGYFDAFKEILEQEKAMNINFDMLSVAVGSCGTYSGLVLGNHRLKTQKSILGINIYNPQHDFTPEIQKLVFKSDTYFDQASTDRPLSLNLKNNYVGEAYGIENKNATEFTKEVTQNEGILFDRVYTSKAFYGFIEELKKKDQEIEASGTKGINALFIHTGGTFLLP
nr:MULTISPECIES: pyridoxal-phosphate dependent enzyme [unclassified Fusibacter]